MQSTKGTDRHSGNGHLQKHPPQSSTENTQGEKGKRSNKGKEPQRIVAQRLVVVLMSSVIAAVRKETANATERSGLAMLASLDISATRPNDDSGEITIGVYLHAGVSVWLVGLFKDNTLMQTAASRSAVKYLPAGRTSEAVINKGERLFMVRVGGLEHFVRGQVVDVRKLVLAVGDLCWDGHNVHLLASDVRVAPTSLQVQPWS